MASRRCTHVQESKVVFGFPGAKSFAVGVQVHTDADRQPRSVQQQHGNGHCGVRCPLAGEALKPHVGRKIPLTLHLCAPKYLAQLHADTCSHHDPQRNDVNALAWHNTPRPICVPG